LVSAKGTFEKREKKKRGQWGGIKNRGFLRRAGNQLQKKTKPKQKTNEHAQINNPQKAGG